MFEQEQNLAKKLLSPPKNSDSAVVNPDFGEVAPKSLTDPV